MKHIFDEHIKLVEQTKNTLVPQIEKISTELIKAFDNNKKVLIFGNGGSAADAQHLAAEFVGRFVKERIPLPVIALTTDSSILTAIGNDYGYEAVFERQVTGLAKAGDVIIGISTSGNSENVYRGLMAGKNIGCYTIGFLGNNGGNIKTICDSPLVINSVNTARIQECHILIGHILCEIVEQ